MSCGQARTGLARYLPWAYLGIFSETRRFWESKHESILLYIGRTGENNMCKPCAHNRGHSLYDVIRWMAAMARIFRQLMSLSFFSRLPRSLQDFHFSSVSLDILNSSRFGLVFGGCLVLLPWCGWYSVLQFRGPCPGQCDIVCIFWIDFNLVA